MGVWYATHKNENIRHPLILFLSFSQCRPTQNSWTDMKKVQIKRDRKWEREIVPIYVAVMPEEWMDWCKAFASALSCCIDDADVCKICQSSLQGLESSAHILHDPNAIFPTAIHQLVKGPCYILLSKLLGRFSQKVNLLWSTLHLIESPAMSLSQHQEMWKC